MTKVFITGSSSFVGQHILNELLQNGYEVTACLRSQEQIANFKDYFDSNVFHGKVEFIMIKELDDRSVLSSCLKGIELVVHVASPTPHPGIRNVVKTIIEPSLNITTTILRTAKEIPSIRRVIITSSLSNVFNIENDNAVVNEDSWANVESTDDYSGCTPYEAYIASKAIVEKEVWRFVEMEKPSFDVITLLMTYVFGDVLIKRENKPSGTNALLWGILKNKEVGNMMQQIVHVRDVADAHVRALDTSVKGNQRFIIANDVTKLENAFGLLEKEFPNEVWNFGTATTSNTTYDNSKAKEVLKIKFRSFENTILDTVRQYVNSID